MLRPCTLMGCTTRVAHHHHYFRGHLDIRPCYCSNGGVPGTTEETRRG